jgi:membrane associated rhomboid family serine protease
MSVSYQIDEANEPQQPQEAHEEQIFAAAPLPETPYYTYIFVASIVIVAVVQMTTGLIPSVDAAGFDKPAFRLRGEYWRILTGAAVHGGLAHIAMNAFAFYSFGRIFEVLSSRAHLAIVFLLSAIGGGLLSLYFAPEGLSVGASGGIVGLISYLAVYTFKRRQFITPEFRKSLLMNIGFIILFGLVLYQVIDNYGHIGGLIVGAVYGLIQIPTDAYADPRIASPSVQAAGLAALGIYLATCVFAILLILGIV